MQLHSTYFLVAHGSRDPRPQAALERLAAILRDRLPILTNAGKNATELRPVVGTGTLELAPISLHEQIRQFGASAFSLGFRQIQLLPLFLQPGVHVKEDIPAEVAIAQQALASEVRIDLLPYLGSHRSLGYLLSAKMTAMPESAWILLAHGSTRPGGNQPIEDMAAHLGAVSAYWAVPPSLGKRVEELVGAGYRKIGILPYFLFAGGIIDAIAHSVSNFSKEFPGVDFYLAEPLGATAELADLIGDLIRER